MATTEGPAPTAEEKARYDAAKDEVLKALAKKREADKKLAQIEVQLYNLEGTYLVETSAHSGGNIIQGFEGYLKNAPGGRRKYEVGDADRLFSTSSTTHKKSLDLSGEGEEDTTAEDSRMSTPGLGTVIVTVPPARTQELTAAQHKKNRDREYQRKKRANAARRSVGTPLSDDDSVASGRRPSKRARVADDD